MKNILLGVALLPILLFSVACGFGSGNGGSSGPKPVGNFTNASFSGQYTYSLTGFDNSQTTPNFVEAGVFTADGNGRITTGTDDFTRGTTAQTTTVSGTYSISNDGTGTATLNFGDGAVLHLVLTLVSSSKAYFIISSTSVAATGFGVAERQTSSAFGATPSGTFTFKLHDVNSNQPVGAVGAFTAANGSVTGSQDIVSLGNSSSFLTFTGSLNNPDTSGRGTGTFVDSSNFTFTFVYYVVSSNSIRIFSTTSGEMGLGRAEAQTGGPFSNASLSGSYAFGTVGDTNANFHGVNTVGAFTANGSGSVSTGAYDTVQDGTPAANVALSGTYSVASTGECFVTLNNSIQYILWFVSPSRAFFLVDDPSKVEDGTVDLQQSAAFTTSTMNGQFALVMDGVNVNNADSYDRVGTLGWNNLGMLNLNEAINFDGSTSTPGFLSGNYTISSNGRAVGSVNSLSNNLVFYLISATDGYVIQGDAGFEINGTISKQP